MSGENWKVQVSTKIGPAGATMVNFRGDTVGEVAAQVEAFNDVAVTVAQQLAAIAGEANAGAGFPQSQSVPDQPAAGSPAPRVNAGAPQGAPGPAPIDQFGNAMVWKQGISNKTNKPWKGWFPAYDKNDPRSSQVKIRWDE